MHRLRLFLGIVAGSLLAVSPALGQGTGVPSDSTRRWHDDAWTPIVTRRAVTIDYLYYPEADNVHDGIVLRLSNHGDVAVRYTFTLIFRAPKTDTTTVVEGRLGAGEMKTGEPAGLFWVPFREKDRSLAEIGLRGLHIQPLPDPPNRPSPP